jgi:hypothetical protein
MFFQLRPKLDFTPKSYLSALSLHTKLLTFFSNDCTTFVLELFIQGVGTDYYSTYAQNTKEYKTAYHYVSMILENFRSPEFDYMSETTGLTNIQVLQKYAKSVLEAYKN